MDEKISDALRRDMTDKQIDIDLTVRILENYNAGRYDHVKPVEVESIPKIDGATIVDRSRIGMSAPRKAVNSRLDELGIDPSAVLPPGSGETVTFGERELERIGIALLPLLSYGILNGGSATSYADRTKNRGFNSSLFGLLEPHFDRMAALCVGRAKGITPAFIQPDGTPGPSFIELKMRALLVQALQHRKMFPKSDISLTPGLPIFQMTSNSNNAEIARTYDEYRKSPMLEPLIAATGFDPTRALTGIQPLLAAFTHSSQGRPKRVFDQANGRKDSALPLPGGHGQNFAVLRTIYNDLRRAGKRYVYIGNVDNLGFTPDPAALAYLALSGRQAAFDFAFRTPVDVKGGILVKDRNGGLTCADIGPAISTEEMLRAEAAGSGILFNCATGLFDLDYLVRRLDDIIENLPMRFSDQDKDAGRYSQAEQVTWEIIGMLDDFVVFGVDKWRRFLAAKLLMETLMTSGVRLDDPSYPTSENPSQDIRGTARLLHEGLTRQLSTVYGMEQTPGKWIPLGVERIETT